MIIGMLLRKLQNLFVKEDKVPLKTRILNGFFFKDGLRLVHEEKYIHTDAQEPWPQLITMYQPLEVEQILLPDNANCLAVRAFLKMCNLEFQIEPRMNAEHMSPSGTVPFIKCGPFLQSEFLNIVSFIESKGTSLSTNLEPADKSNMRSYISLINNVFINAELYICWIEETNLNNVTKKRYGSVYPWPLNYFLNWQKRRQVIRRLSVFGWYNKTLEGVLDEVKICCTALSKRLEGKDYFFGEKPTEVDALVFGHVHTFLTFHSFPPIQEIFQSFPKLVEHHHRISTTYFIYNLSETAEDFEIIRKPSRDSLWDCSETLESLSSLSEDSIVSFILF